MTLLRQIVVAGYYKKALIAVCLCIVLFAAVWLIMSYEGQEAEVGSQESEVRYQMSEVRGWKSEVGSQGSEVESQGSEVGSQESEVGSQKSEVGSQKSEVESQRSEVESQGSEVESQGSEVESQKSEVGSQESEVESQKSEAEGQESKVRYQMSEVRGWKSEVGSQESEVGSQKLEVGSRKSEVGSQGSEVESQRSEIRGHEPIGSVKKSFPVTASMKEQFEYFNYFIVYLKDDHRKNRVLTCDVVIELNRGMKLPQKRIELRKIIYNTLKKLSGLPEIKRGLKEEIKSSLNNFMDDEIIKNVYFTRFLLL